MKFLSYLHQGRTSYGVMAGADGIVDLGHRFRPDWPDLRSLINRAGGRLSQHVSSERLVPDLRVADVEFLPVIPNPEKILCVGLNYESHRLETGRPKERYPVIFTRFADTQIGHRQPLVRPSVISTMFDYEGEVAVIIGKSGYRINPADADEHIAGYACYNDASLRDWQRHTHQFTPGKNFPGTGAFGPYLVTPDEIGDVGALRLTTRVNGTVVQDAGTDEFLFSIPDLIAYCSSFTALHSGDVILTGTPGGVGFKRTPPLYLCPGDVVEVEVTGLGVLSNQVMDETTGVTEH